MSGFEKSPAVMLGLQCSECEARGEALGILVTGDSALFCPHGVQWGPIPTVDAPTLNAGEIAIKAALMALEMRAKWQGAEAELVKLRGLTGGLTSEEIGRRSRYLANRAPRRAFGRVECPLCRREKRDSGLTDHLVRQHRAEISSMKPEAFV